MIKNERQYRIAKAKADTIRRALTARLDGPPPRDLRYKKWRTDALQAQLGDLERELADFDGMKAPSALTALAGNRIGELLIRARVARGWSQRELAERLGLQHQKIAEYEASDYARASQARIDQVLQALGAIPTISFSLVDVPADFDEAPKAVTDLKVNLRHSLSKANETASRPVTPAERKGARRRAG